MKSITTVLMILVPFEYLVYNDCGPYLCMDTGVWLRLVPANSRLYELDSDFSAIQTDQAMVYYD
jgi:hypothetical protein